MGEEWNKATYNFVDVNGRMDIEKLERDFSSIFTTFFSTGGESMMEDTLTVIGPEQRVWVSKDRYILILYTQESAEWRCDKADLLIAFFLIFSVIGSPFFSPTQVKIEMAGVDITEENFHFEAIKLANAEAGIVSIRVTMSENNFRYFESIRIWLIDPRHRDSYWRLYDDRQPK